MDLAALPAGTGRWAQVADHEPAARSGAGILALRPEEYPVAAGNTAGIQLRPVGQAPQPQLRRQNQSLAEECMVAEEGTEESGSVEVATEVLQCYQSKQLLRLHWPCSTV